MRVEWTSGLIPLVSRREDNNSENNNEGDANGADDYAGNHQVSGVCRSALSFSHIPLSNQCVRPARVVDGAKTDRPEAAQAGKNGGNQIVRGPALTNNYCLSHGL